MKAERLALGSAAVLTPTDAAALIGGREADALAWIRARVPVRTGPGGRELVIWADVLDELRRGDPPEVAPTPARGVVPFPRVKLGGEGGGRRKQGRD